MLAIIQYNAGNTRSVLNAMKRLGVEAVVSNDAETIRQADQVIFPGVGEANTTMKYLKEKGLDVLIRSLEQPVLGICLGMQLLCNHSEENDTVCLGIIPHEVKRFIPGITGKVPHMGWNSINVLPDRTFPDASVDGNFFYFVHSYYVDTGRYTTAVTDYIHPFSATLQKDNFFATQFHPEKSGKVGEQLLKQFLNI